MCIQTTDANEVALAKHLQQKEDDEIEYQQMLDELEGAINIDEAIVSFNKIVESYGFELDFTEWIAER